MSIPNILLQSLEITRLTLQMSGSIIIIKNKIINLLLNELWECYSFWTKHKELCYNKRRILKGMFIMLRRFFTCFLCVSLLLLITSCATGEDNISASNQEPEPQISESDSEQTNAVEIDFWTFPIGDFGNEDVVEDFALEFNKMYPNITVNVKILDFATGDAQIEEAIERRGAPDIVFEGPERLVANWGARGLMIDLSDMWDEETTENISKISKEVVNACRAPDGAFYQYPLVMTAHVMAINYEVFEQSGALQYIDEESRTWTTDDFIAAMETIRDSNLIKFPGVVYTGGQGGDQGTRALVTNFYGASFTNEDHNAYTINDELGIKGLSLLQDMVHNGSLSHNPNIAAAEELQMFASGETSITLAWNAANESSYAQQVDFTPLAMNFPSDDGIAQLQGGIWGFGIFNNGDPSRVNASKLFIEFLADDPAQREKSILATQFFPVNSLYSDVYVGTEFEERMMGYFPFMKNLGDYYQVTIEWTEQRSAWFEMLQKILSGEDVTERADEYVNYLQEKINA